MGTQEILLIVAFVVVVLMLIGFVVYKAIKIKPKGEPKQNYTEIASLFGENNIKNVERTEKRVRIEVKDLNLVDLEGLKPYTNGVFTIGNKVVVTFKENTENTVKALEGLIKWKKILL
mgnify:FL=1